MRLEETSGTESGRKGNRRAPDSSAIGYLIGYLREMSRITGYIPPRDLKVNEILDERGLAGHSITLNAPRGGFSDEQRESLEAYARTLTYWRNLLVELDWTTKDVTISFTRPPEEPEEAPDRKPTIRERVRGKPYFASRAVGQALVNQGFMVREPVSVIMVTTDQKFYGYAIMTKYPGTPKGDEAGIFKAYDKWVPLLADIVARSFELKHETVPDGLVTTIFFTKNKNYVPSIYDPTKSLRLFVPRRKGGIDPTFFTKSTYRACKALAQRYKKDFNLSKKPLLAWGVMGHSLIMNYKKGADGKIIDDSYLYNVRLMTEKLMRRFHTLASIRHHTDTRSLVVTFYVGAPDRWVHSTPHADGVAVIEQGDRAAVSTRW